MTRLSTRFLTAALILGMAIPAQANITRKEKKQIKQMVEGSWYLRMDAPCATGRHPYGTYIKPLVEIGPEGAATDTSSAVSASLFHADTTYWALRINDEVVVTDWDVDETNVELTLEGRGSAEGEESVIKLTNIASLADLEAAMPKALSRTPLQDDHEDWSDEMKAAVAERKLVDGMNKRQAFYVTGQPVSFEKAKDGDQEIEIWKLRTERGIKLGYLTAEAPVVTNLPEEIRFVDGQLVDAPQVSSGNVASLSLD